MRSRLAPRTSTSMILVDDRVGSRDIAGYLRTWGVPHELTRLDYGDAAFEGNGPDGPLYVGVEIKAVRDALNCMTDGRFAGHQLPGLVRAYDRAWLVVEGFWYPRFADGVLLSGKPGRREPVALGRRQFMYRDLANWITSMEVSAGIRGFRTSDRIETARFIACLASWWGKDWSDHHAHLAFDRSGPDVALLVKPGIVRRVAAELPGVGWKKSGSVSARFKSVQELVAASQEDWAEIPGIGDVMAQRIYESLRKR